MVGDAVTVRLPGVAVTLAHFDGHQIELAMAYAALCHDRLGKLPHIDRLPAQDDAFDAVLVIQVSVQRGYRQITMLVLDRCQTFCQVAFISMRVKPRPERRGFTRILMKEIWQALNA